MKKLIVVLSFFAISCSGSQHPAPTWDVTSLAAIHGGAHALVLLDDSAAAFYQARTDQIAAQDGGLRGPAYLAATASIDTSFHVLLHDMDIAREGLLFSESLVRQARATFDAPTKCRAIVALGALSDDLEHVLTDAASLGLHVDSSIVTFERQIDTVILTESAACVAAHDSGDDFND